MSDNLIIVRYVCELNHCPGEHGTLEFVKAEQRWILAHPDSRIQKMAECYLESYQRKSNRRFRDSLRCRFLSENNHERS